MAAPPAPVPGQAPAEMSSNFDATTMLISPAQVQAIPDMPRTSASWSRDGSAGSAPIYSQDAMMGVVPLPGSVDWLQHAASFGYSAPSDTQENIVESLFRRCRFDSRCAADILRQSLVNLSPAAAVDAQEELLGWWCRRCWEHLQTKDMVAAVKRCDGALARSFTLASWCRFNSTARRATSGGAQEMFQSWRRCREARSRPAEVGEAVGNYLAQEFGTHSAEGTWDADKIADSVVDLCCGDSRCISRAVSFSGLQNSDELRQLSWERSSGLLGMSTGNVKVSKHRKKS